MDDEVQREADWLWQQLNGPHLYILGPDGEPEPTRDTLAWARWMEEARESGAYRVAETLVRDIRISTVFLGIDYNAFGLGAPLLWETMTFGADGVEIAEQYQERYTSRSAAERGHAETVGMIEALGKVVGQRNTDHVD